MGIIGKSSELKCRHDKRLAVDLEGVVGYGTYLSAREALLANPEILPEAMQELQRRDIAVCRCEPCQIMNTGGKSHTRPCAPCMFRLL